LNPVLGDCRLVIRLGIGQNAGRSSNGAATFDLGTYEKTSTNPLHLD